MAVLKYSRQREAIKNYLQGREDHPSADMVYDGIRGEFPNISLGTVYRNLSLLTELGEIIKIPTEGADQALRQANLPAASQKAGVDPVKGQAQGLPVSGKTGHLVGEIQEGISRIAGVGRQKGRGHRAALEAHGGQSGHDNRQRAAAKAAEIVDSGNTGRRHGKNSFLLLFHQGGKPVILRQLYANLMLTASVPCKSEPHSSLADAPTTADFQRYG